LTCRTRERVRDLYTPMKTSEQGEGGERKGNGDGVKHTHNSRQLYVSLIGGSLRRMTEEDDGDRGSGENTPLS